MQQVFAIVLRRVSPGPIEAPLRELLAELRGCEVVSIEERPDVVRATMSCEVEELHSRRVLRVLVSIVIDRAPELVRLIEIRTTRISGSLEHVRAILKRAGSE